MNDLLIEQATILAGGTLGAIVGAYYLAPDLIWLTPLVGIAAAMLTMMLDILTGGRVLGNPETTAKD